MCCGLAGIIPDWKMGILRDTDCVVFDEESAAISYGGHLVSNDDSHDRETGSNVKTV